MEFIDPNKAILRDDATINEELETQLLEVAPTNWTPILMQGRCVIDGDQRVMVARKHKIPAIPVTRAK